MKFSDISVNQIKTNLGLATKLFPKDEFPSILYCAAHYGHGRVLGELINKAFLHGAIPMNVLEGLISIALYNCDNMYCYVIHSSRLLNLGMSQTDISNLLEYLEFPKEMDERDKWNKLLRLTFFSFKDRHLAIKNLDKIKEHLQENEYDQYIHVLSLTAYLEYLITVYHNDIEVKTEPLFFDPRTKVKPEISKFIKYYEQRHEQSRPVFVLCSCCKDLKDADSGDWHKIEDMIHHIPSDAIFSHSLCEKCFEQHCSVRL